MPKTKDGREYTTKKSYFPEEKRTRINILLSETERKLCEQKMRKYGYRSLSVYLRDAAIYENLLVEDVKGKEELLNAVNELISLFQYWQENIKPLYWDNAISQETVEYMKEVADTILTTIEQIKLMLKEKVKISYQTKMAIRKQIGEQLQLPILKEGDN